MFEMMLTVNRFYQVCQSCVFCFIVVINNRLSFGAVGKHKVYFSFFCLCFQMAEYAVTQLFQYSHYNHQKDAFWTLTNIYNGMFWVND